MLRRLYWWIRGRKAYLAAWRLQDEQLVRTAAIERYARETKRHGVRLRELHRLWTPALMPALLYRRLLRPWRMRQAIHKHRARSHAERRAFIWHRRSARAIGNIWADEVKAAIDFVPLTDSGSWGKR